jgi:hypothetical protein
MSARRSGGRCFSGLEALGGTKLFKRLTDASLAALQAVNELGSLNRRHSLASQPLPHGLHSRRGFSRLDGDSSHGDIEEQNESRQE